MNPLNPLLLSKELSVLVVALARALQQEILEPGPVRHKAQNLHQEEQVGEPFEVWSDLLARRAAVLWILKSVYVRVLEDRGLLGVQRILDPESQQLFARLAPSLGESAYLTWVYRELALPESGLADLFTPQQAELAPIPDAFSRRLLDFWRAHDPDTGLLRYDFSSATFDGRLMGDLYQDLDPVVKARFALLQTPDFVLEFMLDETLTPAIAEWGVEQVRLLDPACGSGHFLLAAFRRLVAGMREKYPQRAASECVADVLGRVVGIDLNDYACQLARARLIMVALELSGASGLAQAGGLHPQIFWADGLEQVELEDQVSLITQEQGPASSPALLKRAESRAALRPMLRPGFHVVVGNPPYITEKDPSRKEYHREKVGKEQRYVSAYRKYSLCVPFIERALDLCVSRGFIGLINANSFLKREFGKALIEKVLPKYELLKVVDTSGAFIPGHGTPTVILFARRQPPSNQPVLAVMGKRGEPGRPEVPAQGKVWQSILTGHTTIGFENEFVSTAHVARAQLHKHPWSLGGGGAAELKSQIDDANQTEVGELAIIGVGGMSNADEIFVAECCVQQRRSIAPNLIRPLLVGEDLRDWAGRSQLSAFFPYDSALNLARLDPSTERALWSYRTTLSGRAVFGGGTYRSVSRPWYEWHQVTVERYLTPLSIAFAEVATHNHFVLDRGGKVFKQTAPVIKLPVGATEAEHLSLLGLLNSSTACFWMKQVFQAKGGDKLGDGARVSAESWMDRIQIDSTKLRSFPLPVTRHAEVESYARALDGLARARSEDTVRKVIDAQCEGGAGVLREGLSARRVRDLEGLYRMVGLQEELDWLCYRVYGLDDSLEILPVDEVPALIPGQRPFEVTLARANAEHEAALARGELPDEAPSAWFERHGWAPRLELEDLEPRYRALVEARQTLTAASRSLELIEQATYKRRWYRPDHEEEERSALVEWLEDRLERWSSGKGQVDPFTAAQVAAGVQSDRGVQSVVQVLTGRPDFDLEQVVLERLLAQSVPNNKYHVYKPSGLLKRAAWEKTWAEQHREDAGESVTPAVPPKYGTGDFLKSEYWHHRGALDVPKERFIAFTEVPGCEEPLFGWAGWTPQQRAKLLLDLDEALEQQEVGLEERAGLLYGVWSLLPYVMWESKESADEFRAILESLGFRGSVEEIEGKLRRWSEANPLGKRVKRGGRTGGRAR